MKDIGVIIAAIILILVVIGGGAFFLMSSKSPATTQTKTESVKTQNNNIVADSIKSLLGKTAACTISYPTNETTGVIYVSGNKFRGDFSIMRDGKNVPSGNVISDGTYTYAWSPATSMGVKMKMDAVVKAPDGKPQGVDINQRVNLKCLPWVVDNSKFTVPSNIKFSDVSQLLQNVPSIQKTTETQTQGASACDQITDPTAKAACAKALQGQGY